jgi:hypothetical protein
LDGGTVEVVERDGVVEITPAPVELEIVTTNEGSVAMPVGDQPVLTDEDVSATLDSVRR